MGLNWGIVGVGQGGNNIADAFTPHFPAVVAINSALTDLRALKNIPRDRQIAIGEDGAGKNIAIGERAFKKNLSTQTAIPDSIRFAGSYEPALNLGNGRWQYKGKTYKEQSI